MPDHWDQRAEAAVGQFAQVGTPDLLLAALQQFRMESTRHASAERRRILDAGRIIADRAAELLQQEPATGDTVGLLVETGLYLIECARPTVSESGYPAEALGEAGGDPDRRLGPALFAEDYLRGLQLVTRGFARGMARGGDVQQLHALRRHIVDTAAGLLVPSGRFQQDAQRLALLCGIAQQLEDDLLFTQAVTTLSSLFRDARQPEAAEQALNKALQWPLLGRPQRDAIKGELASALSEQHKFADAEAIQRELLGD